jgi:FkbM family methyltransferase
MVISKEEALSGDLSMLACNVKTKKIWDRLSYHIDTISSFIDVGVGHPNSESWWCSSEYPECKIIGFEPNISRFNKINQTYPGTIFNNCLGDKVGQVEMFTGIPEYPNSNSDVKLVVETGNESKYNKCKMDMFTLDYIDSTTEGLGDDIVLWADVEGSELIVLKGASSLMNQGRVKYVCVELLEIYTPKLKSEVVEFLTDRGFELLEKVTGVDFIFKFKG